MPMFKCYGTVLVSVECTVEADNEEAALAQAGEVQSCLEAFAGNGNDSSLVGVNGYDDHEPEISADVDIDWEHAEVVDG